MSNQPGLTFIFCNCLDDAIVSEEITTTTCLGIYIPDFHGNTQQEDCDMFLTTKIQRVSDFRESNTDGEQKQTAIVLFLSSALDVLILNCDERLLDEQLSGSNIGIVASESPIALKSSEKLDHALSYREEIEEAEIDNEAIKNDEYTPIEADKDKDHPAIEDEGDDDYIPLETNTSSDDNNLSIGNDEVMDDTSRVKKKKEKGS
ncbi:hypothetical protein ILUMI_17733, partial [Ignelater luminosus]